MADAEQKKCNKTTKAGNPCRSWALHGYDVCMAHAPAKVRESAGFIAANGKAGRKPLPKPNELARQLLEQHIEVVFAPHFKTLGYDIEIEGGEMKLVAIEGGGAKIHGESKDGEVTVSPYDDLGAMITAAEKLLDRIYGRPKQTTELTGEGGGPIETRELIPADADFHTEVAQVLAEAEAIKAA